MDLPKELQAVDADFTWPDEREEHISSVLKATLRNRASDSDKVGEKLADDILSFVKRAENAVGVHDILWTTWSVIFDIASNRVPRHDSLIRCLCTLRQRDDSPFDGHSLDVDEPDQHSRLARVMHTESWTGRWEDLPGFSHNLQEHWSGSIDYIGTKKVAKWKNFHSFVARFAGRSRFAPFLTLVICLLRDVLEDVAEPGRDTPEAMETKLRVAHDWILNCGGIIFEDMTSEEALRPSTARTRKLGPLCPQEIGPRSVERWQFWKKRFAEFATDTDSGRLDSSLTKVLLDTVKIMDSFEVVHSESEPDGVAE
ncbi:hypothetical protein QBC46DRAFT_426457 [Diplogelasinospora grovesii]|uniref:Uncharacterized protein n=1 Tax=Diplogelasinospora grovesii TaxID=303347 RepID=A0AAN6NB65_9PEZI|nr:hypothetical protein QBC46DRAFT_426457 [Diplogelasinospora grovesii]